MSDAKISREEAQAEIDGLLVAEICRDFGANFHGVYPDHILARGVGPEQAFIGLAIKRGHLVRADVAAARIADLERQLGEAQALIYAARQERDVAEDAEKELAEELRAVKRQLAERAAAQQREARRTFPILKGDGAKIDYQLVADHAEQAQRNHGQSVDRLAARGGLSWSELYAVLQNRKWEKVDTNEAMIACRSLEARYLAALSACEGGKE